MMTTNCGIGILLIALISCRALPRQLKVAIALLPLVLLVSARALYLGRPGALTPAIGPEQKTLRPDVTAPSHYPSTYRGVS